MKKKCKLKISRANALHLIFKIMLQSKLKKRLDTFDEFWNSFYARNASFKKQVGLYKVDTIDNPNMITTTVN